MNSGILKEPPVDGGFYPIGRSVVNFFTAPPLLTASGNRYSISRIEQGEPLENEDPVHLSKMRLPVGQVARAMPRLRGMEQSRGRGPGQILLASRRCRYQR